MYLILPAWSRNGEDSGVGGQASADTAMQQINSQLPVPNFNMAIYHSEFLIAF